MDMSANTNIPVKTYIICFVLGILFLSLGSWKIFINLEIWSSDLNNNIHYMILSILFIIIGIIFMVIGGKRWEWIENIEIEGYQLKNRKLKLECDNLELQNQILAVQCQKLRKSK